MIFIDERKKMTKKNNDDESSSLYKNFAKYIKQNKNFSILEREVKLNLKNDSSQRFLLLLKNKGYLIEEKNFFLNYLYFFLPKSIVLLIECNYISKKKIKKLF